MIKTVIRINNDMVMVFDEKGEEMPEYQGYFKDVKDRILEDARQDSVFKHWFGYLLKPETVSRKSWGKYDFPPEVEIFTSCVIDK